MTTHFRRGQSKVYYASEVWDPGEDEEFARTSFRSDCSAVSEQDRSGGGVGQLHHTSTMHHQVRSHSSEMESYCNNDDFVASLMRRTSAEKSMYSSHDDLVDEDLLAAVAAEEEANMAVEDLLDETPFSLPIYAKPLPLLGHPSRHSVLNRSAELDDILEEESDDENSSPSPPVISSPSSNSPDGSFRLRNVNRRPPPNAESSSSASSTDGRVGTPPSKGKVTKTVTSATHQNTKNQDSGFSDSAASDTRDDHQLRVTRSESLKPLELLASTSSEEENGSSNQQEGGLQPHHIEVIHETRASASSKQYHVSKVYFYSVRDVLTEEESASAEKAEHVSILDCETGRVRKGYAQPAPTSPVLSPPMSPPLSHRINVSTESEELPKLDPLACDINYFDTFLEHKPLPVGPAAGAAAAGPPPPPAVKNSKIGTSSLGRKGKWRENSNNHECSPPASLGGLTSPPTASPNNCTSCRSPSQFPKTNGSLYESLSLGRRCHCEKRPPRSLRPSISSNEENSSASVSLPSPAWTGTAYDSFDDPLTGSRRSFRSISDLSVSSGPTSPWGEPHTVTSTTASNEYSSPPSSVVFWLRELCLVHEAECTIMLQSKPIGGAGDAPANSTYNQTHLGNFWAGNSKDTIRAIQSRAHAISAVFAKLCKQLGNKGASKLVSLVQGLSHQVHLFLVEYNKVNHLQVNLPGFKPRSKPNLQENVPEDILHQQRLLLQCCDRLKLTVSRTQTDVVDVITQLGATFTKLIELMLSKEIKSSVDCLQDVKSDSMLRNFIDNIITLALEGNHLCRLIAKHGGVRSLLTICVNPRRRNVRVNAFRALGTVCCVLEGIMELEDAGGIEILSDTLKDENATEEEKSEAAGLLAQVTSPWIENNNTIEGLSRHLNDLVQSLTSLSAKTSSAETFLLSTAAIANLTFMEASVVPLLKNYNTAKILVNAVNQQQQGSSKTNNKGHYPKEINQNNPLTVSIYIQDQVAAVLANMAANADCRCEVVKHGGVPLLLNFLMAQIPNIKKNNINNSNSPELKPEDYAQMAATERVLQKSAIAISRLCNDKRLAEEVVRLEGLGRLVELCKNESERVGSDGVLVACLAAVRKIAAAVGPEKFKNLDATELVEPRLLDSFLIFSSRNESFV